MQVNIYNEFTPLCLESLVGFMRGHPDLYIVTDVKSNNADTVAILAETCPDHVDHWIAFAKEHPLLGYTYPKSCRTVERYIEEMKKAGVILFTHTINDPAELEAC